MSKEPAAIKATPPAVEGHSEGERDPPSPSAAFNSLKAMAAICRRCPLYRNATQTVFGEGPVPSPLMLVGEQPGDQEDLAGRPFVGPAGKILDRALAEAGIDRGSVYLTNAVKHFKNEPRGKRRLHKRPNRYEIMRCKWWLDGEAALVRPSYIVALGATAAWALLGREIAVNANRGRTLSLDGVPGAITLHPSAILRMRDERSRERAFAALVHDLTTAKAWMRGTDKP